MYTVSDDDRPEIKWDLALHYADKRDVRTLEYQLSQMIQVSKTLEEFYLEVNSIFFLVLNKLKKRDRNNPWPEKPTTGSIIVRLEVHGVSNDSRNPGRLSKWNQIGRGSRIDPAIIRAKKGDCVGKRGPNDSPSSNPFRKAKKLYHSTIHAPPLRISTPVLGERRFTEGLW